ncbi:hypothetical protein L0222_19195 [bacterium]|nr:hypothetical protein [bacterium]
MIQVLQCSNPSTSKSNCKYQSHGVRTQSQAEREWGYATGVTILTVVERITRTGAVSLLNPAAESESRNVLQLPGSIHRQDSAYVDLILPMKKNYSGKQ